MTQTTAPATDAAKQWDGWGTALKPAHEPIVLARKPFKGTVAANVLEHSTGAINVDGCRIGTNEVLLAGGKLKTNTGDTRQGAALGMYQDNTPNTFEQNPSGRFPANLILDPEAGVLLDQQSGECSSAGAYTKSQSTPQNDKMLFGSNIGPRVRDNNYAGQTGGASRFFYCAKASRRERNAGLDGMEEVTSREWRTGNVHSMHGGRVPDKISANHHPTVKPIALMRYLIKLVTPPGGLVCDPFTGSGTTLCAAVIDGYQYIGIDMTPEYIEIAKRRVAYWAEVGEAGLEYEPDPPPPDPSQTTLF